MSITDAIPSLITSADLVSQDEQYIKDYAAYYNLPSNLNRGGILEAIYNLHPSPTPTIPILPHLTFEYVNGKIHFTGRVGTTNSSIPPSVTSNTAVPENRRLVRESHVILARLEEEQRKADAQSTGPDQRSLRPIIPANRRLARHSARIHACMGEDQRDSSSGNPTSTIPTTVKAPIPASRRLARQSVVILSRHRQEPPTIPDLESESSAEASFPDTPLEARRTSPSGQKEDSFDLDQNVHIFMRFPTPVDEFSPPPARRQRRSDSPDSGASSSPAVPPKRRMKFVYPPIPRSPPHPGVPRAFSPGESWVEKMYNDFARGRKDVNNDLEEVKREVREAMEEVMKADIELKAETAMMRKFLGRLRGFAGDGWRDHILEQAHRIADEGSSGSEPSDDDDKNLDGGGDDEDGDDWGDGETGAGEVNHREKEQDLQDEGVGEIDVARFLATCIPHGAQATHSAGQETPPRKRSRNDRDSEASELEVELSVRRPRNDGSSSSLGDTIESPSKKLRFTEVDHNQASSSASLASPIPQPRETSEVDVVNPIGDESNEEHEEEHEVNSTQIPQANVDPEDGDAVAPGNSGYVYRHPQSFPQFSRNTTSSQPIAGPSNLNTGTSSQPVAGPSGSQRTRRPLARDNERLRVTEDGTLEAYDFQEDPEWMDRMERLEMEVASRPHFEIYWERGEYPYYEEEFAAIRDSVRVSVAFADDHWSEDDTD
ncbi:hypothetical protein H0H81_000299 [Sphagnurus paluster]|uniref:Uncharacterized protein n=1 Tax=Sphagnurus paluster TaxID=117069 RepID=A0A9P7K333_9AGAR|nr:hypothetical protein H0H81_000299 [Sphagnurus paluster]